MVGQLHIRTILAKWKASDTFPRFIILKGSSGSGKKLLADAIARDYMKAAVVYPGNTVADVRHAIDNAYRCGGATAYIFPDADNMSPQAKNALLKVTEEPPRQAYFIMTVESAENTLATLLSRAQVLQMDSYTAEQLISIVSLEGTGLTENDKWALKIAQNPGQLKQLREMDAMLFYSFCEKVLDNIGTVSGVNAFKIGNALKFKEDAEGYDPILFFEAIKAICFSRIQSGERTASLDMLFRTIIITGQYAAELQINGIKKESTFDMWILHMRDVWRESL